jgi:hypothetical protein
MPWRRLPNQFVACFSAACALRLLTAEQCGREGRRDEGWDEENDESWWVPQVHET